MLVVRTCKENTQCCYHTQRNIYHFKESKVFFHIMTTKAALSESLVVRIKRKISPVGTDGRLPLSDLDLGSGHTAYRGASLIDLYLHTKFH